jgi:hypothetical protein
MNDTDLARSLQELIARKQGLIADPKQLVDEIIRRDQIRVRLLAGLSICFWLTAVAGLVLLLFGLNRFMMAFRLGVVPAQVQQGGAKADPADFWARTYVERVYGTQLLHKSVPVIAGSLGALLLAALCTVLLVLSSRAATLRQISFGLITLSEQLKQMRQAPAP